MTTLASLVSLFASAKEKEPDQALSLSDFLAKVKDGQWKQQISVLRNLIKSDDRASYDKMKRSLPAVTISCHCLSRDKDLSPEAKEISHSGFLQADFDLKDNLMLGEAGALTKMRADLLADPYVAAVFVGPSGEGIKAVVSIDPDQHKDSWFAAEAHFRDVHGLTLDKSTKDPMRLCFVSHDPEAQTSDAFEVLPVSAAPAASDPEVDHAPEEFHDNDAGRARLFCARWQDEIRFIPERKFWLTWEGRWKRNHSGAMKGRAIQLADEMIQEVAARPATTNDELKAKADATRQALKWGEKRIIDPMLSLAEVNPSIQWNVSEVDADAYLLGTPNAVIDLRTGTARQYSRDDKIILCTRSPFDATAAAPRWERFLEEVFPDPEVRRFVWKAAGYSITGDMGEEVFFIAHNSGRNGKSKFIGAICHVLGDYADTAGQALVIKDNHGADPKNAKAKIVGKRFLRAPEIEGNQKLNIGPIKDIVGGDPIDAEQKFKDPFTFRPVCKLWIATNHKPSVADTGPAIWERIRLIPFERYFKPKERDLNLDAKLKGESSGILNWLIQGALLKQAEGLEPPAKVRAAVDAYKREEDVLADFIEECTESDPNALTPHPEVFKAYQAWAESCGIKFPSRKDTLARQLRDHGWCDRRRGNERINWVGRVIQ